ncbi:MAG: Panacea domain-containing protein, partial [Oscillospiraceae bacterium]|nr:Panacea domain-containing protein [Oscillospiraceae bacterium]
LDKLEDLISYIASKVNNLTRTSINKYLWFIDNLYFKDNVLSITGLRYIKNKFGPVIEKNGYEKILALTTDKFYTEIETNGYGEYEIIKSDCPLDLSLFEDDEIEVIDRVIDVLKDKKVAEISSLSHDEKAWLSTDFNEYISYEYSNDLRLI